jgi:zinc protease
VPKGQAKSIVKADTWQRYERSIPESAGDSRLVLRPGVSDFDRTVIPSPGENPSIKVPDIYRVEIKNGVKVLGAVNDEVPTTTIQLRIPAGQTREGIDKLGVASITASMLEENTLKSTSEELSNQLQKLGSSVSFSAGDKFTTLSIRTLSKNIDPTLAIAMERLTSPKFDAADFERLKKQQIEGLKNAKKNAGSMATEIFSKLVFGYNNSFAHSNSGTIATVEKLTLEDVKSFYTANYGPANAEVIVVSDVNSEGMTKHLQALNNWTGQSSQMPVLKAFPELAAGTLYFIDKPEAAQSEIRIGKRALNYDATGEYYRADLMNYNLGGAFNSRINLNLREDKGYTYGARSLFNGNDFRGVFRAQAGVRADTTADSILQFRNEINGFKENGLTDEELTFMKRAIGQRDARAYETPNQKLSFLSEIMTYSLDKTFVDDQNTILANIDKAELNLLAAKHLKLDEMITVVVGDKAKVMESLKPMFEKIVELDAEGATL